MDGRQEEAMVNGLVDGEMLDMALVKYSMADIQEVDDDLQLQDVVEAQLENVEGINVS